MSDRPTAAGEEALIQGYLAPLAAGFPGALGLSDDCAVIAPASGCELVLTTDAIAAGVHFIGDESPADLAWKALAVNVSDLIAKGAKPVAYLMALALPEPPSAAWMQDFSAGLGAAQAQFGLHLAGGDTDRRPGPLTISITAIGELPKGSLVRRATAQPGDKVYVTGTIGDAYLGLQLRSRPSVAANWGLQSTEAKSLEARFLRPAPQVQLAEVVRANASASMDISDGLVKDLERLCRASGAGAQIDVPSVPLSGPARKVVGCGGSTLADLVTGGEDYEVLACVPPARTANFEAGAKAASVMVTPIGHIGRLESHVIWRNAAGAPMTFASMGWDHL